jgi:Mn2+/Fe2+ NRAMP family transporter
MITVGVGWVGGLIMPRNFFLERPIRQPTIDQKETSEYHQNPTRLDLSNRVS